MKTCAIMEREARKVQERQYAGNRKEHVCKSIVIQAIGNEYNEGTMRKRMRLKQQRRQRVGPPRGDPG